MALSREQIDAAIAALQAQRAVLGDAAVDTALAALRAQRAALAAAAEPAPELRQVTVLFLDVAGSTALGRQLDPEQIQAIMDTALAAFTSLVHRHGGRVMQYAGDSLLAAFGTEGAHEDDAERAVLCALALLDEAAAQARRVQARHGWDGFAVRVGLSSGDVLLGGGVDGEGTIRGSTVNLAARMEQTAPPGRLRISHDTWRLVRGLFEVEPQAPLAVKGFEEPVRSYLVAAALAAPQPRQRRGVLAQRTPLHGRAAELATLHAALAEARPGAGPVLVSVLADAGLGKSRLLDEFLAALPPGRVQAVRADALERRRHRPYGLLRALLMTHFGLADADGAAASPAQWLGPAAAALGDPAHAAVLGQLVGLDFGAVPEVAALAGDARRLRERARHHAAQVLLAPGPQPLLLALDDLHWADEASLELLDELLAQRPGRAVLVLALARPDWAQRRPGWGAAAARHHRLELAPLGAPQALALALALLAPLQGAGAAPRAGELAARVADAAEGNPYFLEELVNMLIDQGVIEVDDTTAGRWSLRAERLPDLRLPPTLKGVLQARLAALPPQQRRALQLSAVAGPVFWDAALAALDTRAPESLPALQVARFVEPQAHSRLDAAAEYAFRHHSVHQVAYLGVLRRVREAAHAVLARWLGERPDAAALQDQIALHLEAAGERLAAAQAWQRAAEAARQRFANADAREHARRALALLGEAEPARRASLQQLLARVCEGMADRDGMAEAVAALGRAADEADDDGARCSALRWQARWHMHYGDAAQGLALARAAVDRAQRQPATVRAGAGVELMHLLGRLGRNDEVLAAADAALAAAREAGEPHQEAVALNQLGMSSFDRGDFETAIGHYEAALHIHRALARPDNEGGTLANLGFAHLGLGELDAARTLFEQAAALCQQVGQLQNLGIVEINLGIVALNLGDAAAAAGWAARAQSRLAAAGDRWAEAAAQRVAGQAALAQGRADDAAARLQAAQAQFEALGQPALALEAVAARAELALAQGALDEAAAHARAVLVALDGGLSLEGTDEPLRVWCSTWRALQAAGDERAAEVLARGRAELQRRAAAIASSARRGHFLRAVPVHRALLDGAAGDAVRTG
jgi:class 3 adenylate cyclase/tetratricopeptide (TPR) repeat protein